MVRVPYHSQSLGSFLASLRNPTRLSQEEVAVPGGSGWTTGRFCPEDPYVANDPLAHISSKMAAAVGKDNSPATGKG